LGVEEGGTLTGSGKKMGRGMSGGNGGFLSGCLSRSQRRKHPHPPNVEKCIARVRLESTKQNVKSLGILSIKQVAFADHL